VLVIVILSVLLAAHVINGGSPTVSLSRAFVTLCVSLSLSLYLLRLLTASANAIAISERAQLRKQSAQKITSIATHLSILREFSWKIYVYLIHDLICNYDRIIIDIFYRKEEICSRFRERKELTRPLRR